MVAAAVVAADMVVEFVVVLVWLQDVFETY